jgi:hypothetical protein
MAYELTLEDILEAEGMQQQQPKQPDEYQLTMEDILEAEAMQPQPEQPMNLMEKIKSLGGQGLAPFRFDSQQADMDMSQLAGEQLRDISAVGKGAQAGFKKSLAGIKGEYYEPEIVPEGEGFAYGLGEMLGQAPLYGAIAAPIAASGGALGAPIIGGLLGGAVAGAATTPGDVPGRALGAAMGAIPAAIPGLKLPNVIKTLMTKSNPEKVAKQIQTAHDIQKYDASKLFNKVTREAENRGISTVDMDKDLINQAMDYLPNTKASRDLINKARTGDYSSVRKLQSDLRARGEKRLQSDLAAERDIGENMLELRNDINKSVERHFENTGNKDLADILQDATSKYRDLKKTYYSHNRIAKLVDPEERLIPRDVLKLLSEDSAKMRRLRTEHPEITDEIELVKDKERIADLMRKLKGPALVGGGYLAGKEFIK